MSSSEEATWAAAPSIGNTARAASWPRAVDQNSAVLDSVARRRLSHGGEHSPRRLWARYRQRSGAVVSLAVLLAIVAFVLAADLLVRVTGHDSLTGNLRGQFQQPLSPGYLLGTDANGRDLLVRLAYAGRVSLLVGTLAGLATLLLGGLIGVTAGYAGGLTDAVLMRLVDVLLCLPGFALLVLISSVLSTGPAGLALIFAVTGWAGLARLLRGEALALRSREYIESARVLGASEFRIVVHHILPNLVPISIVWLSAAIPGYILAEAGLSFLGLGVQIPTPSWGNMLQNASEYYVQSWTLVVLPGLLIFLTVLSITVIGNALRDALDPRLPD